MNGSAPILSLSKVSLNFGGLRAVDRATFSVPRNTITSLIGPNGAGKTTIFNVVSGVLAANEGVVLFADQQIQKLPSHKIAALGIGRTFQAPRVFPEMTVLDNVVVGVRQRSERLFRAVSRGAAYAREINETREQAERILSTVGLLHRARDVAGQLSFGEQRFLSIARTLVAKPTLILMDEPTVGLDDNALSKLTELMRNLVAERDATLLLVEHHMETVMTISHKVVLLVQGAVVIDGTAEEVRNSSAMLEAYLGKKKVA